MAQANDPDLPLVRRAKQADFSAFEELVSRHERRLYNVAIGIVRHAQDAQEVVQATFLSVVEHLDQFREESSFATWISRIATNHALKLLRKRKSRRTVSLDGRPQESDDATPLPRPDFVADWRDNPEQLAQDHETRELLAQALDELDDKYRLVFVLRDMEELSTRETAETLGITESNVKVRLLRARLMLRERLTRSLGDEAHAVSLGHE